MPFPCASLWVCCPSNNRGGNRRAPGLVLLHHLTEEEEARKEGGPAWGPRPAGPGVKALLAAASHAPFCAVGPLGVPSLLEPLGMSSILGCLAVSVSDPVPRAFCVCELRVKQTENFVLAAALGGKRSPSFKRGTWLALSFHLLVLPSNHVTSFMRAKTVISSFSMRPLICPYNKEAFSECLN